jgi:hypothetical protein
MGFEAACLEYEKVKDAVLRVEESHLFISLFALAVEEIDRLEWLNYFAPLENVILSFFCLFG